MKSFLHTVQKNQMLMMTPNSLGRSAVIKSFIKHTTPLKIDPKVSSTPHTLQSQQLRQCTVTYLVNLDMCRSRPPSTEPSVELYLGFV